MLNPPESIQSAAAAFIRDRHQLVIFVSGLLRDAHAAEDVLQEVWMKLAEAVGKGTGIENQRAWCRGVARNLVLRHWEKQRSAKVVADSAVLEAFLDRVELAFSESDREGDEAAARQQALNDCVAGLPERSRRMLVLKYEVRASMESIGLELGQSFETVSKGLYRVRRALLECVERKLESPR